MFRICLGSYLGMCVFFVGSFFDYLFYSLLAIGLFRFSISSCVFLSHLNSVCCPRNLSISSMLLDFLAYTCSEYSLIILFVLLLFIVEYVNLCSLWFNNNKSAENWRNGVYLTPLKNFPHSKILRNIEHQLEIITTHHSTTWRLQLLTFW